MRHDIAGFFWDDTPPPKVVKEKIKRTPPDPVWLEPDYLPGLEEALAFDVAMLDDSELLAAAASKDPFVFDVEVYPNFFCVTFTHIASRRSICFELSEYEDLELAKLRWCVSNLLIIGFNSRNYDQVIIAAVLAGHGTLALQEITDALIQRGEYSWMLMQRMRLELPATANHIDIMEVCPLSGSLKIYGGRLFAEKMQDLPFPPGTELSYEQQRIVKLYNVNDNMVTALIVDNLQEELALREVLSARYKMDLRSKSDAQIAEAVIGGEIKRITGQRVKKPSIEPGSWFMYQPPTFIRFETPLLQWALAQITSAPFVIGDEGYVRSPEAFEDMTLEIAGKKYTVGIGGLHSNEVSTCHYSSAGHKLKDRDVTSYYPMLMINSGKFPKQIGRDFVRVYAPILEERMKAKGRGDTATANSLKIVLNGTFGKTGSPTSIFYAPEMMIQTTVTGQLSLLMLIERMELAGIEVVSANTDGITMSVPVELEQAYLAIVAQWEKETSLQTEETDYEAIYQRDVNNYIAVKPGGKVKGKGAYSNPWSDPKLAIFRFHKNPMNIICTEAVEAFLTTGVPVAETIAGCADVRRFTSIQKVKGGGAFLEPEERPLYLGSAVRWYYAKESKGMIVRVASGNLVGKTEGCRPLMQLPPGLPEDLDLDWYIGEARSMLEAFGLPAGIG